MFLVNANIVRNFDLGGRRRLQVRMDVQNLFDAVQWGNPEPRSDQHELRQDHDGDQQHHAVLHVRDEIQLLDSGDNSQRSNGQLPKLGGLFEENSPWDVGTLEVGS